MLTRILTSIAFLGAITTLAAPADSVYPLNMGKGLCSTFLINSQKSIWMTASHCGTMESGLVVNDKWPVSEILFKDAGDDGIMVFVAFYGKENIPALKLGSAPKQFSSATNYGFGIGVFQRFSGEVLQPDITAPISETPVMLMSAPGMEGMSGGPYVDSKGNVVSLVLGGFTPGPFGNLSYGTTHKHLKEVWDKYGK